MASNTRRKPSQATLPAFADPTEPRNGLFSPSAFAGKVVGITGAGHGIGLATARALAAMGAQLILLELREERLNKLRTELDTAGRPNLCICGDVSRDAVLRRAITQGMKKFGRIDGWVNNAMINPSKSLADSTTQIFRKAWQINTRAPWMAARLLAPIMSAQGGGAIVNISSTMAYVSSDSNTAYTATKAAMEGMTRALAIELGSKNIRVNTVAPGFILTSYLEDAPNDKNRQRVSRTFIDVAKMHHAICQPTPYSGRPPHVANAIVFLLSPMAAYITGTTLTVDGGHTIELQAPFLKKYTEVHPEYQRRLKQAIKLRDKLLPQTSKRK